MTVSSVGHQSERRRRGRLGIEGAVSIPREVSAGSGLKRVVSSSSLLVVGPDVASGVAQGSRSNYRLKLTVRGRSTPESRSRSRTAA
jgi:hypothetical protein